MLDKVDLLYLSFLDRIIIEKNLHSFYTILFKVDGSGIRQN